MAAEALEQSVLESKDKEQLMAIAQALGVTVSARAAKATLITKILESTGVTAPVPAPTETADVAAHPTDESADAPSGDDVILGPDGEPLANWEMDLVRRGEAVRPASVADDVDDDEDDDEGGESAGGESRNARRRRRRRNKNRGADGEVGATPGEASGPTYRDDVTEAPGLEPVEVSGHVDLRDEGYGFVRVHEFLPSRDDAYIPVRLARFSGLRKGDHVTGVCRPAARNEKNPALVEIHTINGEAPEAALDRRRFEDLTPVFPTSWLALSADGDDPVAAAIDLLAPIGKGQRGLVLSGRTASATPVLRAVAVAVERRHPDVDLIVVMIDERPEEVTEMRRSISGDVIATTFDRPAEEHVHLAELALETAKRRVEAGRDVVLLVDGLTRLGRSAVLALQASGRVPGGEVETMATHTVKRFFAAARCLEEGGSLTMLAVALADTGSRKDEAVLDELAGTATMELRLDDRLLQRGVVPPIDPERSATMHPDRLVGEQGADRRATLRRGLAAGADGAQDLSDRLRRTPSAERLLADPGR